jgi:hypothetical protein
VGRDYGSGANRSCYPDRGLVPWRAVYLIRSVQVIDVDLGWLAAIIEHFRNDPAARAAIGATDELDRLRRIEVPAAPRSAQPAL